MIAPGLGLDFGNDMVMVQCNAGGTFGYKFSPTMEALIGVAVLATGRPCHLRYNYEQQQQYTGKRSPFFTTVRYAADKATGKIKAMEADWIVDHGPYSEFGDLLTLRGAQYIGAGYGIENIRGLGKTVCTNHGWGAAFRGYGAPESEFASEVLIDELAEKLGMDPLELRAVNCYKPGDTNPSGQAPEVFSLPDMIDIMRPKFKAAKEGAAANSTRHAQKRGAGRRHRHLRLRSGRSGLGGKLGAVQTKTARSPSACAGDDHGQGADAGALGTAHEALRPLNIAADKIRLVMNDTSKAPVGGPAGGSRSQLVVGNAIRVACGTLIEAMKKPGGGFYTYDEMKAEGREVRQYGKWTTPCTSPDENGQGEPFCCYMYGLFMAEVAVDITTGKTAVEKLTMIADNRQGEQPPRDGRPAVRRSGAGHRPRPDRGL